MTEVGLSLLKVAASVVLLALVLAIAAQCPAFKRLPAELRRKFIHVSLGSYCLLFPLLFSHTWEVLLASGLGIGVFALARGCMRSTLGAGLHTVQRASYGEVYFALSVALLFALSDHAPEALGSAAAYALPLAILTFSDAAAALVGARFGRTLFKTPDGCKSWEGVGAFIITAWLVTYAALALFTGLSGAEIGFLSLTIAVVGAAIEAISTRGLDNLAIPVGVYVVLAVILSGGFDWVLTAAFAATAVVTLASLAAPVTAGRPR